MRKGFIASVAAGAALLGGAAFYYFRERSTEEPDFRPLETDGDHQIRDYPALTVAETVVTGPRRDALDEGFSTLADYIFAKSREGEKLPMTVPVMQDGGDPMASDPPLFDDDLQGGGGDDWLYGYHGADTLTGGAGSDTIYFESELDSTPLAADFVTDFQSNSGAIAGDDIIDFSDIDANTAVAGDQAFVWEYNTPTANSLWYTAYVDNGDGTFTITIAGDVNGDTTAEFEVSLLLTTGALWFDDMIF